MKKQSLLLIISILLFTMCSNKKENIVSFGIISDVHEDLQKDAIPRLQTFLDEATKQNPDFIIQLGDLCHSKGADKILPVWNSYKGEKYSMLGNHDMDNATKEEMVKRYNMPASYYYFDKGRVRFIVLDCEFTRKDGQIIDYNKGNYYVANADRDLISEEQLIWMKDVIMSSSTPCVIFSHQAMDEIGGSVPNRDAFREILREVNKDKKRVIASVCGHHHIDALSEIDEVAYLHINSASYLWVSGDKKYSNGNMAEYQDPVYAFITIDLDNRIISVKGTQSKFIEPAPVVDDFNPEKFQYINAGITSREIPF